MNQPRTIHGPSGSAEAEKAESEHEAFADAWLMMQSLVPSLGLAHWPHRSRLAVGMKEGEVVAVVLDGDDWRRPDREAVVGRGRSGSAALLDARRRWQAEPERFVQSVLAELRAAPAEAP